MQGRRDLGRSAIRRFLEAPRSTPLRCRSASCARARPLRGEAVSRCYERASLIVTSNKPFSAWGEIFGDEMAAVAMVDRPIHHAELISLKGDSYRLKDRDLGPCPTRPGDTA
jgi:hypothetical protein